MTGTTIRSAPRSRASAVAIVVLATVAGVVIRLASAPYYSLQGDELATLKWSVVPAAELLGTFGQGATSHLHDLFMRFWIGWLGPSPFLVRLPSLLAGIAIVPLVYWLGRRWFDGVTGAVGALLAACSKPMIVYAKTARPYAILTLAVMVSMALFAKVLRTEAPRPRRLLLVVLAALDAAMLAWSLNSFYVIGVQVLAGALFVATAPRRRWSRAAELAAAFAMTAMLAALFYHRLLGAIFAASKAEAGDFYRPEILLATFESNHPSASLVFLAALLAGVVIAWRSRRIEPRLLVLWACAPPLLYLLSRIAYPVSGLARYLVPTLPAQFLLIASSLVAAARLACSSLGERPVLPLATLGALAAVLWNTNLWSLSRSPSVFLEQKPTSLAVHRIGELARPEDVVTIDLESRLYWLLSARGELAVFASRDLARRPSLNADGRLLVLALDRPRARPTWSKSFHIEEIGGPMFRERLLLLRSAVLPAGPDALREPLQAFLRGYVDGGIDESHGNWWKISRQYLVLAGAHRQLASLSQDEESRRRHLDLGESCWLRSTQMVRSIGRSAVERQANDGTVPPAGKSGSSATRGRCRGSEP